MAKYYALNTGGHVVGAGDTREACAELAAIVARNENKAVTIVRKVGTAVPAKRVTMRWEK